MKRLAGLLLVWIILCSAGASFADQTVVISFLGDCTIGCQDEVYDWENGFAQMAAREGYAWFFREVQPLLSLDDLTVANFEGVLKENAYGKTEKTYNFRGLPDYAQILAMGSVEAVGLSNNHAEDYGEPGQRATREALLNAGVHYFDSENVYIYEKNNIRIAFLSVWERWMFQFGQQYVETVSGLKAGGVNAVVIYVHFGEDYSPYHMERQTTIAMRFIDAGADLIIGSHPHVLQGIDLYGDRLILYSLGNFVFGGNVKVRAMETMIPQVTFAFSDDGEYLYQQLRVYPANVSGDALDNDYQPRLLTGEAADAVYRLIDQDSADFTVPYVTGETCREYEQIPPAGNNSD
ncbi:MAG: CapA family protein [Bacillota bacterium]